MKRILDAQADQLLAQESLIENLMMMADAQTKTIEELQENQRALETLVGDTRRKQIDNDKLVQSVTAAVQAKPVVKAPQPPPKFNSGDRGASRNLVFWIASMKLYFETAGFDMSRDADLIAHTLLNMTPSTASQAMQISQSAKPEEAGDDWAPTFLEFTNALVKRWGGNPAQEASQKITSGSLKQIGSLESYIVTFTRLVEEAAREKEFILTDFQQVTQFVHGLQQPLGQMTVQIMGGLKGKTLSQATDAANNMNSCISIMDGLNAGKATPPAPKRKFQNSTGQTSENAPKKNKPPLPKKKGAPGQKQSGTPSGIPAGTSEPTVTCYKCGNRGHKANFCPQLQAQGGTQTGNHAQGKGKKDFQKAGTQN